MGPAVSSSLPPPAQQQPAGSGLAAMLDTWAAAWGPLGTRTCPWGAQVSCPMGRLQPGSVWLGGLVYSHAMGFLGILSPHPAVTAAQEHPEHCRAHRALGAGAGGNAVPAAVAVCPRESRASGCQEHSWRAWDLLSAPGWGCFLPRIAKSFSSREVNESLARMGTTLHQHFQLVS